MARRLLQRLVRRAFSKRQPVDLPVHRAGACKEIPRFRGQSCPAGDWGYQGERPSRYMRSEPKASNHFAEDWVEITGSFRESSLPGTETGSPQ
jgi:hypothetical protein